MVKAVLKKCSFWGDINMTHRAMKVRWNKGYSIAWKADPDIVSINPHHNFIRQVVCFDMFKNFCIITP